MKLEIFVLRRVLILSLLSALLAGFIFPVVANSARNQELQNQKETMQPQVSLELIISSPASMPLFRKGHGINFAAMLINRSDSPVVFLPPRKDWPEEHRLEWQAVDVKGHEVDREPQYFIWCDPHGTMRAQPVFTIAPLNAPPKQIRDSDLVVLQPGDKYEIASLADPSFSLNFLKRGVYQVSLSYDFDPSRYRLPKGSKYAAALKKAGSIYVISNTLKLNVN